MYSLLCQLCQTIPLYDLPRFPDESYSRTLSGRSHLHHSIHDNTLEDIPNPLGFHHHTNLENLRSASASGCEICHLIETEVDALLADIMERDLKYSEFPQIPARLGSDPSFDLWITKRPDGGDGFWVITKSAPAPEKYLFFITSFSFASENDDPLALTFLGRPVNGLPDRKVLDRIASWVTDCDNTHGRCKSHDYSMPTRIIDVGTSDAESTIKLVEVDEGTKDHYIALSYCWGIGTKQFTTSRSSLSARKAGIYLPDLPQTFQDAVAMVRVLGVRYLWIDSICIFQDDLMDWERESAQMATVYSNAYLTIAATGKPNSSGGLFFERPSKAYLRLPLKTTSGIEGHVLISPLHKAKEFIKSYRTNMRSEPLAERAWAFQERVLARRVIHFASDQISFECLKGSIYEDGLRLPYRYLSIYLEKPTEISTCKGGATSPASGLQRLRSAKRDSPLDHWNALLCSYSSLKLTYPADKLPALAGIAKVYSQLLDDEYIAGIWRKSMIEGLCWQSLRCKAVGAGYRAPSWSWASVDGTAATGFGDRRDRRDPVATILDYHVELDGDNPFGRVKSGWIRMEAPLVPLALSGKTGPVGNMFLRTEKGDEDGTNAGFDTLDKKHEVSADRIREMKLFALVAAQTIEVGEKQAGTRYYHSIIVTPVDAAESSITSFGPVKRLGWMIQEAKRFGLSELNDCRATFTFV